MATLTLGTAFSKSGEPAAPNPAPPPILVPNDAKFFIIWNPLRSRPKARHASLDAALAEAARLQALYPHEAFLVYQAERVSA